MRINRMILGTVSALFLANASNVWALETEKKYLKLMTLNMEQYPQHAFANGRGERFHRSFLVAQQILAMQPMPDVIGMQELWTNVEKRSMIFLLRREYPYYAMDQSPPKFGAGGNSGLLILSRFPIVRQDIHHYGIFRGEDNFSRKGVLGALIQVSPHQQAFFFTTHMQAGGTLGLTAEVDRDRPDSFHVRSMQLVEARTFIERFCGDQTTTPAFFAGDFNIDANDRDEGTQIPEAFPGALDPHSEGQSEAVGTTWEDDGITVKHQRIDYMLQLHRPFLSGYSWISNRVDYSMTDHLTVLGQFYFN